MKQNFIQRMKRMRPAAIAALAIVVLFSGAAFASQQQQEVTKNTIILNIAYDRETGLPSAFGFSAKAWEQLGLKPFDTDELSFLDDVENAHLRIEPSKVEFEVNDQLVLTLNWDKDSRGQMLDLINKVLEEYNLSLTKDQLLSIEKYAGSTTVDLTFTTTKSLSNPFTVHLDTPLWVDVSQNGNVSVENFPLDFQLDEEIVNLYRAGGVENALVCVEEGTIKTTINNEEMPQIQLHKEGLLVLNEILNLGIENETPFFETQIGIDLSLDGANHVEGANCGQ